ncbi:MAG: protein kinase [Planctomycetes bacterium]|nr:protein kinase [Planctomycetota bacterium]
MDRSPPLDATPPHDHDWPELKELLADALDAAPADRSTLLERRCHGRPALRARAEALLAATPTGDFLDRPLLPATAASAPIDPLPPGTACGPYQLDVLLGEGGFSEVYRAVQKEPIPRLVAIKLLKPGLDSRALLARFQLERRTLARLEHPGIARILDAGAMANGRPFLVMEHVAGVTLARFLAEHAPPLPTRLALFRQVCEAVMHAHRRGVIHRDLKPGNLMVTQVDGAPVVKVIDFGVAKVLAGDDADATHSGLVLGTPAYCSPEQYATGGGNVDVRTDVFALGVVLAELVSGERPRRGQPCPSPWPKELPRELGWIAACATHADPAARYPDVAALLADLDAFAHGESLRAGPGTRTYRFARFVRRHRLALLVTGTIALAWILGGIAAAFGMLEAEAGRAVAEAARTAAEQARSDAEAARDAAERAQREANAVADYLARLIQEAIPARSGRDVRVVDLLDRSGPLLAATEAEPDVAARLQHVVGNAYAALGELDKALAHLQRAADSYRTRHGELHWPGIEAASDLAGTLLRFGRLDEVAERLADVARRAVAAKGPDHPLQRLLIDREAKLAFDRGRPAEAEAPLRRLLELDTNAGRVDARIQTLGNLAQVLLGRNALDEALELATQALALARTTHGDRHPLTLSAVRKLAAVQSAHGDQGAAVTLLEPALPLARGTLGDDHPETLGLQNMLARAFELRGDVERALALYEPLVEAQARRLGRLHPQALMTLQNYAGLLLARQAFAAAVPLLEDSRARFRELRGADDVETLRATVRLCDARTRLGDGPAVAGDFASAMQALRQRGGSHGKLAQQTLPAWVAHLRSFGTAPPAGHDAAWLQACWQAVCELAGDDLATRRLAAAELARLAEAAGDADAASRWREAAR